MEELGVASLEDPEWNRTDDVVGVKRSEIASRSEKVRV